MSEGRKSLSAAAAAGKFADVLVKAVAVAAGAGAVLLYSGKTKTSVLLATAAGAVILFCLPRTAAFSLLLLSSFLELVRWEVGFTLKIEHVFIIFLILIVSLRPGGIAWKRIPPTHYPVAAYIAVNIFSSLLFSIEPEYGLKQAALVALVALSYFVVSGFCLRNPARLKRLFHLYLVMGVLHSIYGILSLVLLRIGIHTGGAYTAQRGEYYVRGMMYEGNLFGGLAAMHALMLFNMAQDSSFPKSARRWLWPAVTIHVLSIILSNTRTAVMGFLIGIIVSFLLLRGKRMAERMRVYRRAATALAIGIAAFSIVVTASGQLRPAEYVSRLMAMLDPSERPQTLMTRIESFERSLEYWRLNPVFGHGAGSFKSFQRERPGYEKNWIGNQFVLALQDTGIVGGVVTLWLLGASLIPYRSVFKNRDDSPDLCYQRGFFTALLCIWICFQMTTGFWMSYFWIWLGFSTAFLELNSDGRKTGASPQEIS